MTLGTLTVDSTSRTGKTRVFSAELLAYVLAADHWDLGDSGKALRPVLFAFAASEEMAKAFTANLRLGQHALLKGPADSCISFELPRSAGHRFDLFHQAGATLVLAYLQDLFSLKPGMLEADELSFLCLPTVAWVEREASALAAHVPDPEEAALAAHFVAHLDHRTPLPIPDSLEFHRALYRASLTTEWCLPSSGSLSEPSSFVCAGLESIGFHPQALACKVDHSRFHEFLAAQITLNPTLLEASYGTTGLRSSSRLLSHPFSPAAQHSVALELRTA